MDELALDAARNGGQAIHGRLAIVTISTVVWHVAPRGWHIKFWETSGETWRCCPTILESAWSAALVNNGGQSTNIADIEYGSLRHSLKLADCCDCILKFANASALLMSVVRLLRALRCWLSVL